MRLRVGFSASSVAAIRARLEEWMHGVAASRPAVDDAVLVISELVANAVRHGTPLDDGRLLVAWDKNDGTISVSVRDGGGSSVPRVLDTSPGATSGRGLGIVDTIAERLWVTNHDDGRTVHALLSLR